RNPIVAATTAPPSTNSRLGSQSPAMSRKPRTFAGFIMPEMVSPNPKSSPAARAERFVRISAGQDMTHDKDSDNSHGKECQRRGQGTRRKARQAANAVAAGAAPSQARAIANEEATGDQQG